MSKNIPHPNAMEMNGDLATNWETFKDAWDNYYIATELSKKPEKVVVATLLSIIGTECFKIYKNLPLTQAERESLTTILDKLGLEFQAKRNIIFERYLFNSTIQEPNESFDRFLHRLRQRASTCKYDTLEAEMLRDRIVIGIENNDVRERLLRENELVLDIAINICRTTEMASRQLQNIEHPIEEVKYARANFKKKASEQANKGQDKRPKPCKYCGDQHPRGNCKAYGQICTNCNKRNHFAKVCQSKTANAKHKVHAVQEEIPSDSDDSIYNVNSRNKRKYIAELEVSTLDKTSTEVVKFQIDTGATCSTLREKDYRKLTDQDPDESNTILHLYGNATMKPVGQTKLLCTLDGNTKKVHFQIVKEAPVSLLSGKACEALKLLQFNEQCVHEITSKPNSPTKEQILQQYSDIFGGLGTLPGTYHIQTDSSVIPVQNNPRRVPIPVQEELKAKIKDLEDMGVIAKVEEPTQWISNMVAIKQPNKLRICIDPLELNKAIIRNHYPTPTIDDVAPKLTKAKIFSVVDAKDGFLQVLLDEDSSYLTTFWTPYGRYRWLRMPFGIKSAPEEFQRRIDQCLEGLSNNVAVFDDILVYGTGDTLEEASESHDKALKELFDRCRERGLQLNLKKFKYKQEKISYLGHIISSEGIHADPDKVQAIKDMPQPSDIAGVQRLLGVVTYLAKFLPQLSTIAEPLRRLTDKDAVFDWLPQHENAFAKIKSMITSTPILHYYDKDKEVTIESDSSEVGLGAVISQEGHPIAYASRALSQTERNYAQIEKECLSIVFATERFEHYILGKEKIRVQTDHKPLVTIFKKSILTSPKRLQRMRLRLQKFSLEVEYKPGPKMHISDTLSRASLPLLETRGDLPNYQIFQVKEEIKQRKALEDTDMEDSLFVSDQRLNKIRQTAQLDSTMQTLMQCIKEGWPESKNDVPICVREYWPYRDELSTQNGLAYRGTRIIIPESLRKEMISRSHASHLGIQYTTSTARDIMYWPKMSAELTEAVRRCPTCQESQPAQTDEPMMTHPVPQYPWQSVASDCFEVQGEHFVIVVDSYSDYIEVNKLKSLSSSEIIDKLKHMFSTHGSPAVLITDNGTNYSSSEFRQFTTSWDINHVTVSPHHHKSNGKAESAVKIAKGIISKSKRENKDIWKALLEWRNAATPGLDSSPAQRLMSRRTRSTLPCKETLYKPQVQENVTHDVIQRRKLAKFYHDKGSKQLPKLIVGQPVQVKVKPQQPRSPWKPGIVSANASTPRSYIVNVGDRSYRRNRIHLRDTLAAQAQCAVDLNSKLDTHTSLGREQMETTAAEKIPHSTTAASDVITTPSAVTRSGRSVKAPSRFMFEH